LRRLRDLFTLASRGRYVLWRASKVSAPVRVELRTGETLLLRPPPSTDLPTAYEIFVAGAYRPPEELPDPEPELVVDLGANVGFSVVLFAERYPRARILAFEPHPLHLAQLYQHVALNDLSERVEIVGAAASDASGHAFLTEEENESRVVGTPGEGGLPIRVRDLFGELAGRRVDLLKMDIEGGEFEVLRDRRFSELCPRTIVLEWHNTERTPDGKRFCVERLTSLGYQTAVGAIEHGRAGMLWAWRPAARGN
jgi:FkbM family methyltransferase